MTYATIGLFSVSAATGLIIWLAISLFRLIPKGSRASAKRHALFSFVAIPVMLGVAIYAGLNEYRDYGLESPEGLQQAILERRQQEQTAALEREAANAVARAEREAREAQDRANRRCNDGVMAVIMSERFISQHLRAPSTAKYPSANSANVAKTGDCSFRVVSYVDAQNAFGAMLRSPYQIDMEYLPDTDRWRGSNAIIQ